MTTALNREEGQNNERRYKDLKEEEIRLCWAALRKIVLLEPLTSEEANAYAECKKIEREHKMPTLDDEQSDARWKMFMDRFYSSSILSVGIRKRSLLTNPKV